ncbi:glycosyltransferase family 4 protein [Emcibacter sp.]|uniref:glycosyltransferase family 4 protein n=1 Tax=Emcibacter sp. TaxID=1979954 RepID=UPI002AA73298|nr:glycosyltransferase family 4 protein [Emcibacter sp.]
MARRKILLVSNMYPSERDPIFGAFVVNIEEGLKSSGGDVEKIVIKGRARNLVSKIAAYLRFYFRIFKTDLNAFDFVHISYPSHSFLPFFFKRRGKAKIIVRLHGHDLVPEKEETFFFRIFRRITLAACGRADLVVVPSAFFEKELSKCIEVNRVYTYPSGGIDSQRFFPEDRKNEDFTIGYVGRIDQMKGVPVLLKALSELDIPFKAILVGAGPFMEESEALLKRYNLSSRCILVGAIPNKELPEYYNSFDVLVFPTLYQESFGNVAIEAMACGKPVIASRSGAIPDYVSHRFNGYLFEPGNDEELARLLKEYHSLAVEEKKALSSNARNVALKYDRTNLSNAFYEFLLGL